MQISLKWHEMQLQSIISRQHICKENDDEKLHPKYIPRNPFVVQCMRIHCIRHCLSSTRWICVGNNVQIFFLFLLSFVIPFGISSCLSAFFDKCFFSLLLNKKKRLERHYSLSVREFGILCVCARTLLIKTAVITRSIQAHVVFFTLNTIPYRIDKKKNPNRIR